MPGRVTAMTCERIPETQAGVGAGQREKAPGGASSLAELWPHLVKAMGR